MGRTPELIQQLNGGSDPEGGKGKWKERLALIALATLLIMWLVGGLIVHDLPEKQD